MNSDNQLRNELVNYLKKPHTHTSLRDALKDLPENLINAKPEGVPYSFWELLEHIRISQYDMIDFIQNENFKEMEWPKDYWPDKSVKADKEMWSKSIEKFEEDLQTLEKIIINPENDLMSHIKHGNGQTILREIFQIIDHNSYHIGELVLMRRAVNNWK